MKKYYVGFLCLTSDIAEKEYCYFTNNKSAIVYGSDNGNILVNGIFYDKDADYEKKIIQNKIEPLLKDRFRKNEMHFYLTENYKMKQVRIIYEIVEYKNYLFAKELYTGKLFPIVNSHFILQPVESCSHQVLRFSLVKNSDVMILPKIIVINSGVADKNKVADYQNKYKFIFKKNYIKKIERLYDENIFKEEIKENEPIIKEKQNTITTEMENIEFLIEQVTDLNEKEGFKKKICRNT